MNTLCYVQLVSDEKAFINLLQSGCNKLEKESQSIAQFTGVIPSIHSLLELQTSRGLPNNRLDFYRVIYHQHFLKDWGFEFREDADPLIPQYQLSYCLVYVVKS